MEIIKHIHDYLRENNKSVVVPDLGCFYVFHKPSEIKGNVVIPPVKTIAFDSDKTENDNIFTHYIAKKESITPEQAAEEIRTFYSKYFLQRLSINKQPVYFTQFGTFSLKNSNITFEPVADLFKDNFGLGNAHIPSKTPEQPAPPVKKDDSLFNLDNTRYRENTEKRRNVPAVERNESPEPPQRTTKKPPQKGNTKQKKQNEKPQKKSNTWVIWLLLIAGMLGVGGFYGYPYIKDYIPNIQPIISFFTKDKANEGQQAIPILDNEFAADSLNVASDATADRRNALDPDENQPQSVTQPPPQTSTSSQANAGRGRWVVIIGSFGTRAAAESFGKKVQTADGFNCEVIDAGRQRYRVSAGRFETEAEANRFARQIRPKYELWVARQ